MGSTCGHGRRPAPAPARDLDAVIVLDPEQQRAVDLPPTPRWSSMASGVGKTLVALYRVASLERRADETRPPVPGPGAVPTEGCVASCACSRPARGDRLEIAVIETG